VRLTSRGLDVVDRVVDVHVENEARLLAGLTRAERRALDRLLRRLLAGLEAFRPGGAT
jgi:DNA-binding MarR family transcriptional regulator